MERHKHSFLKLRARVLLKEMGCSDIVEEYVIAKERKFTNRACREYPVAKVDVIGFKNGMKIAVECGGSKGKKLSKLADYVDEIYILPYGESEVYQWQNDVEVCVNCGHRI